MFQNAWFKLFIVHLIFISGQVDGQTCHSLFSTEKSAFKINQSQFEKKLQNLLNDIPLLDPTLAADYRDYFHDLLNDKETGQSKVNNPQTSMYILKDLLWLDQPRYMETVLKYVEIFYKSPTTKELVNRLSDWIQTEEQAILVYNALMETRLIETKSKILSQLMQQSPFFSKHRKISQKGLESLITFSYEKESPTKSIVNYFRFSKYTEAEWFRFSIDERFDLMKHFLPGSDGFKSAKISGEIIPTKLMPRYIKGPFLEIGGQEDGFWEVNHRLFEISEDKALEQLKVVNKMAEDRQDSIHFHIVFHMAKNTKVFLHFREWYKALSDYILIKGFEEGLHPGSMTQASFFNEGANSVQEKFLSIKGWGDKFKQIGLRGAETYGQNPRSDFRKLGLELRDVTRNLGTLKHYVVGIADHVQKQIWNEKKLDQVMNIKPFRIEFERENNVGLLTKVVGTKMAQRIYSINKESALPLFDFENKNYYNYRTSEFLRPSLEAIERIQKAREAYVVDLKNLARELTEADARDEYLDFADIQAASRWNITDWAKKARISELLNPF